MFGPDQERCNSGSGQSGKSHRRLRHAVRSEQRSVDHGDVRRGGLHQPEASGELDSAGGGFRHHSRHARLRRVGSLGTCQLLALILKRQARRRRRSADISWSFTEFGGQEHVILESAGARHAVPSFEVRKLDRLAAAI